jgi:hypothetical protein
LADFAQKGWVKFAYDADVSGWVDCVAQRAKDVSKDPVHCANWLRSGGTWFVGADVLGNDGNGRVNGSAPISGQGADFCAEQMRGIDDWGVGQISICYPNYPLQDADEPDASFRYRVKRDTAHLDGLKPIGANKRRFFEEFHGVIFGIPLSDTPPKAAPFVIWEGSHLIFQRMLTDTFDGVPTQEWAAQDLTEIYQQTRAEIFETCKRVEITAKKGECYVAHRFALHGMGSWDAARDVTERAIAYLRPYWRADDLQSWLTAP